MTVERLPEVLDLLKAEPLRRALCAALDEGRPLVLEASGVARISTPCVQVLLAAARAAEKAGLAFTVRGCSAAMHEAFAALGLGAEVAGWAA